MDDKTMQAWRKFLDPDLLRTNLISASLFLTGWELLRECVIEQPKGFFVVVHGDLSEDRQTYREEILCRDKSPFLASLAWFHEQGAVDDDDLTLVDLLYKYRCEIAHELPAIVMSDQEIDIPLFGRLVGLVDKIDRWWIREIECAINPLANGQAPYDVPDSEIHSGRMIVLSMMLQIATGDEEQANVWKNMLPEAGERPTWDAS
ncbi:hypothetical protein [Roseimaritima ulvae]|nr:hypothetical protein [Roseimaritima ulvae]